MSDKNRFAFFQGKIVPIQEARVSIMTSSFNYGTAVFEGIRAYWNKDEEQLYVFRLKDHYERFLQNARMLLMELPYTADQLSEATLELLKHEEFKTDTYIRPLSYKSTQVVGVRIHDLECDCAVFAIPFGEYIDRPDGARLAVSSWRRIADNSIPARGKIVGAYVNSALAKTEAMLNGFDDALMLSGDGQVSEASAANLFVVRDGTLFTPSVTDDILEGITRATVLQMAEDLGHPVVQRRIDRSELYVIDEAFICGTGVNVVPVVEVDHRKVADGKPGPITKKIRDLYYATARGEEKKYREWCTPVYDT